MKTDLDALCSVSSREQVLESLIKAKTNLNTMIENMEEVTKEAKNTLLTLYSESTINSKVAEFQCLAVLSKNIEQETERKQLEAAIKEFTDDV